MSSALKSTALEGEVIFEISAKKNGQSESLKVATEENIVNVYSRVSAVVPSLCYIDGGDGRHQRLSILVIAWLC